MTVGEGGAGLQGRGSAKETAGPAAPAGAAGTGSCLGVAAVAGSAPRGQRRGVSTATAASLGIALTPVRAVLIAVLALATGAAVAQVGLIAFIGLVAPHLVRAAVQPTYRWLLPLAALAGGVLLLAADVLARWLLAPQELPVGVLTAVLGGGYLIWLMHRRPL